MGLKRFLRKIKNFYYSLQEIQNHWFIFFEIVLYGLFLGAFTFLYHSLTN